MDLAAAIAVPETQAAKTPKKSGKRPENQRSRRRRKAKQPVMEIDNPFYYGAQISSISKEVGEPIKIKALRSKNDVINRLWIRGSINDDEERAARKLEQLLKDAEMGHLGGLDLTNEPVDGGRGAKDRFTDRHIDASRVLAGQIWPLLGKLGQALVRAVLVEGMMPEEFARRMGMADPRDINRQSRNFADYMGVVADHFGYRLKRQA